MTEYKIIYTETKLFVEEHLNKLAEEGWRVICSFGCDNEKLLLELTNKE